MNSHEFYEKRYVPRQRGTVMTVSPPGEGYVIVSIAATLAAHNVDLNDISGLTGPLLEDAQIMIMYNTRDPKLPEMLQMRNNKRKNRALEKRKGSRKK